MCPAHCLHSWLQEGAISIAYVDWHVLIMLSTNLFISSPSERKDQNFRGPDWEHMKILRNALYALTNMYGSHGCYSDVQVLRYSSGTRLEPSFPVLKSI